MKIKKKYLEEEEVLVRDIDPFNADCKLTKVSFFLDD